LGKKIHVIAFTHVQAFNVDGMTVLHYLHKYIHCKDVWILLDEYPNNNIDSDGHLQKMHFMGCKFVLFGDIEGQLPPILDQHRLELWSTLDKSNFMHILSNGLRIELNKFRRGPDRTHFEFTRSIKQYVPNNDVKKALASAKANYPNNRSIYDCDLILTTTNNTRIHINQILNDYHSHNKEYKQFKCKYNNGPQDMKIWKGIILQSAVTTYSNKKGQAENSIRLRNACRYVVNDIDDVAIYIQQSMIKDQLLMRMDKHIQKPFL